MTIAEALRASGIDAREARLLLAAATGLSEAGVLAHPERSLPENQKTLFIEMAGRRALGEPVAYILGYKEFYGMELAVDPAVLLADEPSGNLDHMNSERLHDLLATLARDLEIGMVVVTHNRSLAARADRVLLLEDGRLKDTDVREGVA